MWFVLFKCKWVGRNKFWIELSRVESVLIPIIGLYLNPTSIRWPMLSKDDVNIFFICSLNASSNKSLIAGFDCDEIYHENSVRRFK